MIPFFDFSVVEKISVDAVKHKFLTMKVDHMNGAVSFSVLVGISLFNKCLPQHPDVSFRCLRVYPVFLCISLCDLIHLGCQDHFIKKP